jgi:hypothetical protein
MIMTDSHRQPPPPKQPVPLRLPTALSAEECLEELAEVDELAILRASVAHRRLLRQAERGRLTGKIHTDVLHGVPRETYIVGERVKTA